MTFAAIDIGSNAVRLLLSDVIKDKPEVIRRGAFIRFPVRLGDDAFDRRFISVKKIGILVRTMSVFRIIMDAYRPVDYMACATSALREASNGPEITDRIERETGILVEIIGGQREAEIIHAGYAEHFIRRGTPYLSIEVGGGSTELTMFSGTHDYAEHNRGTLSGDGKIESRAFAVGTVRMLKDRVDKAEWNDMREWVKTRTGGYRPLTGIGSGGNINALFKMSLVKDGMPLDIRKIRNMYTFLRSRSLEDRIKELGLSPDRADVIIPAMDICLAVMKWADISEIIVPRTGLVDGIVRLLYENNKSETITAKPSG